MNKFQNYFLALLLLSALVGAGFHFNNGALEEFSTELSCFLGCDFEEVEWDELVERDGIYYKKFTADSFTGDVVGGETGFMRNGVKQGRWFSFDAEGQLKYERELKNGEVHGSYKYYCQDGKLQQEGIRRNEERVGIRKKWDCKSGALQWETEYDNYGDKVSSKTFYGSGNLERVQNYLEGSRHGIQRKYYDNGTPSELITYSNGKKNGLHQQWHENGQIRKQSQFLADKLQGELRRWSESGQLTESTEYDAGKEVGISETWWEGGEKDCKTIYKGNASSRTCWWENGKVRFRSEFTAEDVGWAKRWSRNGNMLFEWNKVGIDGNGFEVYDGEHNEWNMDGIKVIEHFWSNGKKDGKQTNWYKNGQLRWVSFYKNGAKEGKQSAWHEDGSLAHEKTFKDGLEHGLSRSWWDNGHTREAGHYNLGKRVGLHRYWEESGQISTETKYSEQSDIIYSRMYHHDVTEGYSTCSGKCK